MTLNVVIYLLIIACSAFADEIVVQPDVRMQPRIFVFLDVLIFVTKNAIATIMTNVTDALMLVTKNVVTTTITNVTDVLTFVTKNAITTTITNVTDALTFVMINAITTTLKNANVKITLVQRDVLTKKQINADMMNVLKNTIKAQITTFAVIIQTMESAVTTYVTQLVS